MEKKKHEKPAIEPARNGPLIVSNLEDFRDSDGNSIRAGETIALCRCGGSKKKPFCDGTHIKIRFSSERKEDRVPDRVDDYRGKRLTIHDNRGVCAYRGHCADRLPEVFDSSKNPWVNPDGASPEEIDGLIRTCPSGALFYTMDGKLHKDFDRKPLVRVTRNGPYDVEGRVVLRDPGGCRPESQEHYTLCRCGHSLNKPFCDGRHWKAGFRDG